MWWEESKRRQWSDRRGGGYRDTVLQVKVRAHERNRRWVRGAGLAVAGLAVAIGVAALAWLGLRFAGQLLFSSNPLFQLTELRVDTTGETLSRAHIVEYAGLGACTNLFALNIAAVREQCIRDVPVIKTLEITRHLPGTLAVRVTERLPVARLMMTGYALSADREGCVLGTVRGSSLLPAISGHFMPGIKPGETLKGTAVMDALDLIELCETLPVGQVVRVESVDVRDPHALEVRLADGAQVKLAWQEMGEGSKPAREHLEKKLTRLAEILRTAAALGKRVLSVNLTVDNNIPVQYAPAQTVERPSR